ncbi:MAG: hypothetical protein M3Z95_01350 [Actinomycetota bacterium]|nr:hypothetical protein [Actinomycetota bacterium]
MGIDQKQVGEHIAAQMEAIEQRYGGEDSEFEVGNILTIVEVVGPDHAELRVRASDPRPWLMLGVLRWAQANVEGTLKADS